MATHEIDAPVDDAAAVDVALHTISLAMAAACAAWLEASCHAVHPQAGYLAHILGRLPAARSPQPGTMEDLLTVVSTLKQRLPREPMLDFAAACADGFHDFLSGRRSGVQIVFPRGSLDLWTRVQRDSALLRGFVGQASEAVLHLAPPGARLLEIGGGTGATTAAILGDPRARRLTRYLFTDVSPTFVAKAIQTNRLHRGFEAAVFDMDDPAAVPGPANGGFDMILAVNVLHVSTDPPQALRRLRRHFAGGGILIVCEGAPPIEGLWSAEPLFAFLPQWAAQPDQYHRGSGFYDWQTWCTWCVMAGFDVAARRAPYYGDRGGVLVATARS